MVLLFSFKSWLSNVLGYILLFCNDNLYNLKYFHLKYNQIDLLLVGISVFIVLQ